MSSIHLLSEDLKKVIRNKDFINIWPSTYERLIFTHFSKYVDFDPETFLLEISKYKKSISDQTIEKPEKYQKMLDRWLCSNCTDFDVYNDPYYFMDVWSCWVLYSRLYMKRLYKEIKTTEQNFNKKEIKTILDLGSGLGLSTVALAHMFPNAKVIGTNIPDSDQMNFSLALAKEIDNLYFEDEKNISVTKADLIFASEYFEHFEKPINHLKTFQKFNPKYLLIKNTFNKPNAIGHFPNYYIKIENKYQKFNGTQTTKLFNTFLKEQGYTKKKVFWNEAPNYFIRNRVGDTVL